LHGGIKKETESTRQPKALRLTNQPTSDSMVCAAANGEDSLACDGSVGCSAYQETLEALNPKP